MPYPAGEGCRALTLMSKIPQATFAARCSLELKTGPLRLADL
jgi:hypothetical protein